MKHTLSILLAAITLGSAAHADPIHLPQNCPKGGSRITQGGYDPVTGIVDATVILNNCVIGHDTYTGTTTIQGSLVSSNDTSVINLTYNIDTTVSGPKNNFRRTCTLTKNGTFFHASKSFNGTITRNNCTLDGNLERRFGLLETLLEHANEIEAGEGENEGD